MGASQPRCREYRPGLVLGSCDNTGSIEANYTSNPTSYKDSTTAEELLHWLQTLPFDALLIALHAIRTEHKGHKASTSPQPEVSLLESGAPAILSGGIPGPLLTRRQALPLALRNKAEQRSLTSLNSDLHSQAVVGRDPTMETWPTSQDDTIPQYLAQGTAELHRQHQAKVDADEEKGDFHALSYFKSVVHGQQGDTVTPSQIKSKSNTYARTIIEDAGSHQQGNEYISDAAAEARAARRDELEYRRKIEQDKQKHEYKMAKLQYKNSQGPGSGSLQSAAGPAIKENNVGLETIPGINSLEDLVAFNEQLPKGKFRKEGHVWEDPLYVSKQ